VRRRLPDCAGADSGVDGEKRVMSVREGADRSGIYAEGLVVSAVDADGDVVGPQRGGGLQVGTGGCDRALGTMLSPAPDGLALLS